MLPGLLRNRLAVGLANLRRDRKQIATRCLFPIVLSIIIAVCEYYGVFAKIEGSLQDGIWLRHMGAASSERILILEIDDKAYSSCFDSVSPMKAGVLTSLVEQIASVRPAVLGVDVITAAETHDDAYRKFADKLKITGVPTVWISGGSHPYTRGPDPFQWLFLGKENEVVVQPTSVLGFDPGELEGRKDILWGPAVFPTEEDSKLRRYPRELRLSADPSNSQATKSQHTWARVIADQYCDKNHDRTCKSLKEDEPYVFLSVAAAAARHESVLNFFSCTQGHVRLATQNRAFLEREAAGKIVLLGGTFTDSHDFHDTSEGRNIAGIFTNARAIAAEMAGKGFYEITQPWSLLLDIFFGCLVVVLFAVLGEAGSAKGMMVRSAAVAVITVAVLLLAGRIFSIAAVVVATVLQQFWEFWTENPTLQKHPELKTPPSR